jgi:peptidoglycan/LPS O-acetylase OafA/YrhL
MDGVRGLAVLAVVLYHGTPGSTSVKGLVLGMLGGSLRMGWVGVDLFFALSGFLITGILLDTTYDPGYFRSFYLRRALRIFPLYYGLLLLLGLLTFTLGIQWHGTAPYLLLYTQNYIAYDRLTLTSRYLLIHVEHLWSLAIEEQFYLAWPTLVWLFRRRNNFIAVPLALVICCPIARCLCFHRGEFLQPAYLWTPFRADALAWGAVAAWLVRYRVKWVGIAGVILMALGLAVVAAVVFHTGGYYQYDLDVVRYGYTGTGALFCGLLLRILVPGSSLARVFSNRMLRWLGKYSYGIYVYHYLLASSYSRVRHLVVGVSGSNGLGALAYFLCMALAGTLAAYVSYNAYEKRWLRLKDRVAGYTVQRGRNAAA